MPLTEQVITDPGAAAALYAELDSSGVAFVVVKDVVPYHGGEATDSNGEVIPVTQASTVSYAFRFNVEEAPAEEAPATD